MLNASNKIIARAIATAYCNANLVCQDSLFSRLNNFLDDNSFALLLSELTSRRFAVASFSLPMSYNRIKNKYYSVFSFMDIINGEASNVPVEIDAAYYNPNNTDWKKTLESVNRPYLRFEKIVGNKILFSSAQHGGYNIAYTTTPGTGGGTPGGGTPGGEITIKDPETNMPASIQVPAVTSSFNLQSLLIPGAILAGLYLVMKK